jgi:ribosome-associated protein
MKEFKITGDFIELIKLLKATGEAENGGAAKALVDENKVKVNTLVETRYRAKLQKGSQVAVGKEIYVIV